MLHSSYPWWQKAKGASLPKSAFQTLYTDKQGTTREVITQLDASELLLVARPRRVHIPPKLEEEWNLPEFKGHGGMLRPSIGVRLILKDVSERYGHNHPEDLYRWELLITPFFDEAQKRWIADPRNMRVQDSDGNRERGSYPMGEAVRQLAHGLSRMRPPVGAVYELYFAMNRQHEALVADYASATQLLERHRNEIQRRNEQLWKAWRGQLWNWLRFRNMENGVVQAMGHGPKGLRQVPYTRVDPWQQGEQREELDRIRREFISVLNSIWMANYWNIPEHREQLLNEGWEAEPGHRTLLGDDPRFAFITRRTRLEHSSVSEPRSRSILLGDTAA